MVIGGSRSIAGAGDVSFEIDGCRGWMEVHEHARETMDIGCDVKGRPAYRPCGERGVREGVAFFFHMFPVTVAKTNSINEYGTTEGTTTITTSFSWLAKQPDRTSNLSPGLRKTHNDTENFRTIMEQPLQAHVARSEGAHAWAGAMAADASAARRVEGCPAGVLSTAPSLLAGGNADEQYSTDHEGFA